MRATALILTLALMLAAAGCGQTGPLYLPQPEQTDESEESTNE